jgi:hypothetical protein
MHDQATEKLGEKDDFTCNFMELAAFFAAHTVS